MKKEALILLVFLILISPAYASSVVFPNNDLRLSIQSYEPSTISPGSVVELDLRAETLYSSAFQNDLRNLKIELIEEFPFSNYNEKIKELGSLEEGNIIDFKYKIKVDPDAIEGENNIRFRYTSNKISYISPPLTLDIAPVDTSLVLEEISTTPSRIEQGIPSELSITIKNTADVAMNDILLKINFGTVPIKTLNSINEKKIKRLGLEESETIIFDVIADPDATSNSYNIPINLTYKDNEGNSINKNYEFGILIGGEPEYLLNIEDAEELVKGKKGSFVISLSNIGTGDIKFSIISILPSKKYEIISEEKVYLGNLESDDYETAEFTIFPKKSGDIKVETLLEYKDAFNNQKKKIEEINLKIYSSSEAQKYGIIKRNGGIFTLIFYIILIFFVITTYRAWKKHRNLNKALKIALKKLAITFKKIIRSISIKKFIRLIKKIIRFFKEP